MSETLLDELAYHTSLGNTFESPDPLSPSDNFRFFSEVYITSFELCYGSLRPQKRTERKIKLQHGTLLIPVEQLIPTVECF